MDEVRDGEKSWDFPSVIYLDWKVLLNIIAHFMLIPKLLCLLTLQYQCVAILLSGAKHIYVGDVYIQPDTAVLQS